LLTPGGVCRQVLDAASGGLARACVDERILLEYETVLQRPQFEIAPNDVAAALNVMRSVAERVAARPLRVNLPHTSDLPFLEVAHASDAILVTGNLRHFPKRSRAGVTVLGPREFLELLATSP